MPATAGACWCGNRVYAGPGVELVTGHNVEPKQGDFHVCTCCASPLIFDSGRWRPATMPAILSTDPIARSMLAQVSRLVARQIACIAGHGAGGMVN